MKLIKHKLSLKNFHLVITNIVRLLVLIAMINFIINQNWLMLFVGALTIFLTFLPSLMQEKYQVILPIEFEILIILFIYASIVLGNIQKYYLKFPWWDLLIHATSGVALGFVGFLILYILYKGNKLEAKPITIAIFSFSFALAIGTLWEIFEFAMDSLLGTNMLRSGLVDTMWDLIVNSIGALLASSLGYLYLKKGKAWFIEGAIERFKKKNPKMFK